MTSTLTIGSFDSRHFRIENNFKYPINITSCDLTYLYTNTSSGYFKNFIIKIFFYDKNDNQIASYTAFYVEQSSWASGANFSRDYTNKIPISTKLLNVYKIVMTLDYSSYSGATYSNFRVSVNHEEPKSSKMYNSINDVITNRQDDIKKLIVTIE